MKNPNDILVENLETCLWKILVENLDTFYIENLNKNLSFL